MVKWENRVFYMPSPSCMWILKNGLKERFDKLREKYSFKPFVQVRRGDVVCDVGAYIGEFSLAIADKAKKI